MELLIRNAQWTHSHGLHLFQPGIKKRQFPVELLVYKINLLEYKYTLWFVCFLFQESTAQILNQKPVILDHNWEAFHIYMFLN